MCTLFSCKGALDCFGVNVVQFLPTSGALRLCSGLVGGLESCVAVFFAAFCRLRGCVGLLTRIMHSLVAGTAAASDD